MTVTILDLSPAVKMGGLYQTLLSLIVGATFISLSSSRFPPALAMASIYGLCGDCFLDAYSMNECPTQEILSNLRTGVTLSARVPPNPLMRVTLGA